MPAKPFKRCYKKRGECWRNRHKRRLELARKSWQQVKAVCKNLGIDAIREFPDGHELWVFYRDYYEFARWNPWSANFFCGEKQAHVHDAESVLEELRLCLALEP